MSRTDTEATIAKVLIIGAGSAGAAAACRLLENGIQDIIVLEAENRIGGRIYTTSFGNGVVDLGAHWVHGEKGNVVSTMGQSLNMLEGTVTDFVDTQFVSSSGEILSSETSEKFLGILLSIDDDSTISLIKSRGSLGEYFSNAFQRLVSEKKFSEKDASYSNCYLNWFEKFENSIDGSDSWFFTSARGHIEYQECEGNLLQTWKNGGYSKIFDLLTKKYPDPKNELPFENKVQFNKEVIHVEWDLVADDKVRVKCGDNSLYTADHVIITTSLGVLKERALQLFSPELPMKKRRAISGLSIGTVDKIYLRFSHQWWPQTTMGFSLLWTSEDLQRFRLDHESTPSKCWVTDVFGFYAVDQQPNVLCGWVVGPSARIMEALSEEEVTDDVVDLLNRFVGGKYKIPRPVEMLRSAWSANPHFRGSYSFRSMDTEALGTSAAQLAEPLTNANGKQTVLFAGEATHPHFFSTVHGAIESGWREAERVMKLLRLPTPSKL